MVRTDFTNDEAWDELCMAVTTPNEDGFLANLTPVNDPTFTDAGWEDVKGAVPPNDEGSTIVLIADSTTFATPLYPVLVVDLMDFDGRSLEPFRCIASELWAVENNLNLANLDWDDFAGATDPDRIFRGFV